MSPGSRCGRVVVVGALWIGWLVSLPGVRDPLHRPRCRRQGAGAAATAGSDRERLESIGVRIVPILGTPAGPGYTQVFAEGTQLRDDDLAALAGIEHLEVLNLTSTTVSDAGLKHLSRLTGLRWLYLRGTRITDAGLRRWGRSRG